MVSPAQIENVLRGAIMSTSEKTGVSCAQTMLIITTEDDDTAFPVYIVQNPKIRKKLLFEEIYSGFMSGMAETKSRELLSKSLAKYAGDNNVNPTSIRIMVLTDDEQADNLAYFIEVKTPDMQKGMQTQKTLKQVLNMKA